MTRLLRLSVVSLLAATLLVAASAAAQSSPQPARRLQEGLAALDARQFGAAASALRAAVEQDPGVLRAHEAFIQASVLAAMEKEPSPIALPGTPFPDDGVTAPKTRAMPTGSGPAGKDLQPIYEAWVAKYTGKAAVEWGLGKVLMDIDPAMAESHLQKALAIDPRCAPAYRELALLASVRKQPEQRLAHLLKARESAPDDPAYALSYAMAVYATDKPAAKPLLQDVVTRFPKDRASMSSLIYLSMLSATPEERKGWLERLWTGFPGAQGRNSSLKQLFALYAKDYDAKALDLARDMMKTYPADKEWPLELEAEIEILKAAALVKAQKYADAEALLGKQTLPVRMDALPYYLLRAEATGAGDPARAYAALMTAAVPEPRDPIETALKTYGGKLGKTPAQVDDELWGQRYAKATPFKDFELTDYRTGKPVTVADYRGKVVLVNFWFPGCGPCRAEFPMLQEALTKYGPKGFAVLAINIVTDEGDQVLQVLDDGKFGFVPLKMPAEDWAKVNYGIKGAPANFLLDTEGKIIFRPRINDTLSHRAFLKEVESLVARGKQ
jgi:thiol-disulfide isomerase/thioredoxin